MPLVRQPAWDPLPEPPGLDPATLHEFESLAAEDMKPLESGLDAAGLDLAATAQSLAGAEQAVDQLGLDIAAGAEELASMTAAADADTLESELTRAAEQDREIVGAGNELAGAMGEPAVGEPAVGEPTPQPPVPGP